jgi:hypothetical protein
MGERWAMHTLVIDMIMVMVLSGEEGEGAVDIHDIVMMRNESIGVTTRRCERKEIG